MKILNVLWFNYVGIVQVETEVGEIKYYINQIDGWNEEDDKKKIAEWGSMFPKDAGDVLFRAAPFLMYEDKTFYGDKKSLDFIWKLIRDKDMNSHRRSAEFK